MTRKIKIYTTAGIPGTIETNVSTLGELKPLLRQREINYDGMKMLVGETKNELSIDEATLPTGDFKLYLMPAKTKSGVDLDEMEEAIERIENKVDRILSKLDSINTSLVVSTTTSASKVAEPISLEDQREIEELRRLAGESEKPEWD